MYFILHCIIRYKPEFNCQMVSITSDQEKSNTYLRLLSTVHTTCNPKKIN